MRTLRFLGISDEEALDIVRAIPDDDAAELCVFSLQRALTARHGVSTGSVRRELECTVLREDVPTER